MKFPFFKQSKKAEPKQPVKVLVTPPRLANAQASSTGRNPADEAKKAAEQERLKTPEPIFVTGPNGTKEPLKIPVPIQSILSQLPTRAQEPNARTEFANATVQIPAEWIVPQLPKGKASIRLPDLARLLPVGLIRLPLPPGADQQEIILPLASIISAIPPEALMVKNQSIVDIDSPELNDLPALIDDALLQKGQPTPEQPKESIPELGRDTAPAPIEAPASRVTKPEYTLSSTPETTPTHSVNPEIASQSLGGVEYPTHVSINLKSLVAVMPDRVFACARTELWRKADLDAQVKLPIEPLLPQLHTAQAKLPISTVIAAIPEQLFVSPLPQVAGESVRIPLDEIIPQLPPALFSAQLEKVNVQSVQLDEEDIPDPFQEKTPPPTLQQIRQETSRKTTESQESTNPQEPAASPAEPITSQASTTAPEPIAPPTKQTESIDQESLAIADEVLADEGFSLFSEGSSQPPAAPVTPTEVATPIPEDKIDFTPTPEERISKSTPEAVSIEPRQASPETELPKTPDTPTPVVATPVTASASTSSQSEPASEKIDFTPTPEETVLKPTTEPMDVEPRQVLPETESPKTPDTSTPIEGTTVAASEQFSKDTTEQSAPSSKDEVIEPTENVLLESSFDTTESDQVESLDKEDFLIDINKCTAADLTNIQGVGPVLAERIIAFRNKQGPFNTIEDLRYVPGVGRKTFRVLIGRKPGVLNRLLNVDHDRELTLQEIVQRTNALPGVAGCSLAMSDGLFLSGKLPDHLDHDTVSAFAPQLFKKVGRYARELRVGQIRRLTIFTDQQPVSIFQADEIYLIVVHDPQRFSKALLYRCERIGKELGRICRQRATV